MSTERKFKESPWWQGEDEKRAYSVDTSPWGGYDSGASTILKDKDGNDVSGTYLTGAESVSGTTITTKRVELLIESLAPYRLEVLWVKNNNTLEAYGVINWEE